MSIINTFSPYYYLSTKGEKNVYLLSFSAKLLVIYSTLKASTG